MDNFTGKDLLAHMAWWHNQSASSGFRTGPSRALNHQHSKEMSHRGCLHGKVNGSDLNRLASAVATLELVRARRNPAAVAMAEADVWIDRLDDESTRKRPTSKYGMPQAPFLGRNHYMGPMTLTESLNELTLWAKRRLRLEGNVVAPQSFPFTAHCTRL